MAKTLTLLVRRVRKLSGGKPLHPEPKPAPAGDDEEPPVAAVGAGFGAAAMSAVMQPPGASCGSDAGEEKESARPSGHA